MPKENLYVLIMEVLSDHLEKRSVVNRYTVLSMIYHRQLPLNTICLYKIATAISIH